MGCFLLFFQEESVCLGGIVRAFVVSHDLLPVNKASCIVAGCHVSMNENRKKINRQTTSLKPVRPIHRRNVKEDFELTH